MTLKSNNILNSNYNRLSVQVSLTGLSFLVSKKDSNTVTYFSEKKYDSNITPEELLIDISSVITNELEDQKPFSEIIVIYANHLYTTVPTPLFDETKASDYLKFNSKILANDFISYDTIENKDITSVYVPYININNYFFDQFGSFKYYHASTVLIQSLLDLEKYTIEPKAFIHVSNEMFDFIVIKNGKLLICNSYIYKTPEDFIYYILFCFEQLKLNPDTVKTALLGSINKEDDTYNILYKYVRNIEFHNSIHQIKLTDNDETHHHFLLKSLM
ncbi:MAG: DUF3822 family protein [Flavobacteriaceae bacterium]|nr:DUF3822 family protein [Flavobacteriaceae bacterium]